MAIGEETLPDEISLLGLCALSKEASPSVKSEDALHHCPSSPTISLPSSAFGSDLSGHDRSDSEDEFDRHLPLLLPEELAELGIDALRLGHHDVAVKYLLLAHVRWTDTLSKRLATQDFVEIGKEASFFVWSTARYLDCALQRTAFVDRVTLAQAFNAIIQAGIHTVRNAEAMWGPGRQ